MLIDESTLRARVDALAGEIASAFGESPSGLVLVPVLAGSFMFLADLVRSLPLTLRIGMMFVSSYPGSRTTSQGPVLMGTWLPDLRNRDVLIVDDILDTGATLRLVQAEVATRMPRQLKTAVLLRKPGKARPPVSVDFVGFDVEDVFVVGYGLDYDGLYRNLPHIAAFEPVDREPQVTP